MSLINLPKNVIFKRVVYLPDNEITVWWNEIDNMTIRVTLDEMSMIESIFPRSIEESHSVHSYEMVEDRGMDMMEFYRKKILLIGKAEDLVFEELMFDEGVKLFHYNDRHEFKQIRETIVFIRYNPECFEPLSLDYIIIGPGMSTDDLERLYLQHLKHSENNELDKFLKVLEGCFVRQEYLVYDVENKLYDRIN
jgi:hypothetical protein